MGAEPEDQPASRIETRLADARRQIGWRPGPADLDQLRAEGALVVDIRPEHRRAAEGELPGAIVIDRNVLEWRLDPTSLHRIPEADGAADRVVVLVCDEGYASTLAAAALQDLGLTWATDLDGGYRAWRRFTDGAP